uniref:Uncharacterized protein n=1 Tax=Triticum urartu TaxID=4572 RepID=A0A8R7PZT3_TRIUA
MSKEVEAEANIVMQSAQPIVAPAQLLQREAEQVGCSGITPAQTLRPEMQPSASREACTQTYLTIQSAQPSMVPTISQRDVEQASLCCAPLSQCLPSAMHPPAPLSSIPLERTHPDQCQLSHQPEVALGSSAQLFPVASMILNHPPVGDDALRNDLHRLRLHIDSLNKTHELKQSQLRTEYSQEMEKLKQKYDLLLQKQDSTHLQQTKTLNNLCEKVLLNQSLADNLWKIFISSGEQVRAHSPPNHQTPQISQQVPTRPSAVASTASPTASSSAGRPPVLIHHVQPLQVGRPSPSSQVAGPRPSILNNIVRSTPTTFSFAPVLPRGSFGVQSEQEHVHLLLIFSACHHRCIRWHLQISRNFQLGWRACLQGHGLPM